MWVNTSEFAGKNNNDIRYFFLIFLYKFEFALSFEIFDSMYEDLLYGYYSLSFKFSGKVLPLTLTLLFFSFKLYIRTRLLWSVANKKSCKRKKSVQRKCSQLKELKVLLMHLFATILMNKITGSERELENENKEGFLTGSTFCTFELTEKNILRKQLSQDALSKVYLNKYGC